MTFATFDPSSTAVESLVAAIFSGNAGATLVSGSVTALFGSPPGEPSTISFYDGTITALNIGAGLLLTSGDPTPPQSNTVANYGVNAGGTTVDDQLQATVNAAFPLAGPIHDVTYLQFQINVTDPAAVGLRFDVVFGSDEFPEFVNSSYVDVAGVYVNGVDYALFNSDPLQPLSVVQANVAAGNFRDNTAGNPAPIPIEYDGVSVKLQVSAPVHLGVNTIKIAIADTGDSIYDSGIFVSGLQTVDYAGYGLAQEVEVQAQTEVVDTNSNQVYHGDNSANLIKLVSGHDVVDGGPGVDTVEYTFGLAEIFGGGSYSWNGHSLSLNVGGNSSTLVNVERVHLGDGGLYALDTSPGGNTYSAYALLQAWFNHAPDQATLSSWIAKLDLQSGSHAVGAVAQQMIDLYAPGMGNAALIGNLYQNIIGAAAPSGFAEELASQVGSGKQFATMGDLFAFGAMLSQNTHEIVGIVGSIVALDASFF